MDAVSLYESSSPTTSESTSPTSVNGNRKKEKTIQKKSSNCFAEELHHYVMSNNALKLLTAHVKKFKVIITCSRVNVNILLIKYGSKFGSRKMGRKHFMLQKRPERIINFGRLVIYTLLNLY